MDSVMESGILGKFLLNNDSLDAALKSGYNEDDFENASNKKIFSAMKTLRERSDPVDWITVTAELKNRGQLEECGGIKHLTFLVDSVPHPAR